MKHITERSLIESIVTRWNQQYPPSRLSSDMTDIGEQLATATTLTEIDTIIGNDSWTSISCDECGKCCTELIQFGREKDYFYSCKDCIIKAYQLVIG